MEPSIIAIVVGASLLFFGVIAYKVVWFVRKINRDAPSSTGDDDGDQEGRKNDKHA